jgi:hypothetical protein
MPDVLLSTQSIYSKKLKKNVQKTLSQKKYTVDEMNKIFEEWKLKIQTENEEYKKKTVENIEKPLERLNIEAIFKKINSPTFSVVINASSRSGKTYLLCSIIKHLLLTRPDMIICLFTGNSTAECYDSIRNNVAIFQGFRPSIIETCRLINTHSHTQYKYLFVCDDLVNNMRYNDVLNNCMLSWRNCGISMIVLLQNLTILNKNTRNNATVYLFGATKYEETKGICEKFLRGVELFRDLKIPKCIEIYNTLTTDYNFLCTFPTLENDILYLTKTD